MGSKDLHKEAFDEETITKLEIFEKYTEEWLPVFIYSGATNVYIYDFFAGSGQDIEGVPGSPLRILDIIQKYRDDFILKNKKVKVLFNEYKGSKFSALCEVVEKRIKEIDRHDEFLEYEIKNDDFEILFDSIYRKIKDSKISPRLIFIDQNGIKQVTPGVFKKIAELKKTDYMFFISSSYVKRFGEQESFKKYLQVSKKEFEEAEPFHCHRVIFDYYKNLIPSSKDYYMAPFSIKKKEGNIHGLIFCSGHTYGIEKFLHIAWNLNETTGDANYNIDEEKIADGIYSLFEAENKPKKLQVFEKELREKVLNGNIKTNKQVYYFAFDFGCLPKHANFVIKNLIQEKKIKSVALTAQKVHNLSEEKIELNK